MSKARLQEVTLLQALMTKRRWTRERTLTELDQHAVGLQEQDYALSLRQLDRWLSGDVGAPRLGTCRVVEAVFEHPIAMLLAPATQVLQSNGHAPAVESSDQGTVVTGWSLPDTAPECQIAISGSRATGTDPAAIDDAVRAIGQLLMRHRCRVRHGPVGVGIEVMTFIADHYRPPGLGVVTGIFGRPNVVRDADIVIVVGGGQGTRDEVDLAISMGKTIIPMPTSGGAAAQAYAAMQRDRRLRPHGLDGTLFQALADADAPRFVEVVEQAFVVVPDQPARDRPYVLLSCAMSADGYIDDATQNRLLLSNDDDFDRVDSQRAGCDAILVGANTIRCDNPRLQVRAAARRKDRVALGQPPNPIKVTITSSGELDPTMRFFTGDADKVVYCATGAVEKTRHQVGAVATVVDAGDPVDLQLVLADLSRRSVGRLMVEGGTSIHTQFLTAGLADELQLVVAPFFVGNSGAPRFVGDGRFPWDASHRMILVEVQQIGDVALLRFTLPSTQAPHGVTG